MKEASVILFLRKGGDIGFLLQHQLFIDFLDLTGVIFIFLQNGCNLIIIVQVAFLDTYLVVDIDGDVLKVDGLVFIFDKVGEFTQEFL